MEQLNVLAVDDEPFNLDLIELALLEVPQINLIKAENGQEALEKIRRTAVDIVLLDLRMPVMDGMSVLETLKADEKLKDIPVIVVTANSEEKHKALTKGANDFLAKPIDTVELKLRTLSHIELYKHKKELDRLVEVRTQELQKALAHAKRTEFEISLRLGRASEYRDLETGMHIKRMSHYSALLGKLYGLSPEMEELLLYSSPLHDIGKIGIPDAILLKPGKLNDEEFKVMKQHTTIGGKMLEEGDDFPIIEMGKIIALQHHEKWDGSGYPNNIAGEDIHIFARIVAIADVFDALSSKRVYKDAFPLEKTLAIMEDGKGTHFDPYLVEILMENIDKFLEIQGRFPDLDEQPSLLELSENIASKE